MSNVHNAFIYKYKDIDTKIIKSEEYQNMIPNYRKQLPEHTYPEYNLINHSKINFIKYTKDMTLKYEYYGWVDFGRFNEENENIPIDLDINKLPKKCITCQSPHGIPKNKISYKDMLSNNAIHILGASYIIHNSIVEYIENLYEHKLNEMYDLNITDDDQNVLIQLYWDNPKLFNIINESAFYKIYKHLKEICNIHYVTVSTKQNNILDILIKSVEENGDKLTILESAHNNSIAKEVILDGVRVINRRFKIDCFKHYISNNNLSENDIVLFTDGYDVGIQSPLSKIKKDFLNNFSKPIVFSAEPNCYPDGKLAHLFPKKHKGGNNYLNSGMCIGKVWAFKKILNIIDDETIITCDQLWWSKTFLSNQDLIELDYNRVLFLNLVLIHSYDLDKTEQGLIFQNVKSSVVHGNGRAKMTFYLMFIKDLIKKYNISERTQKEIEKELQYPWGWK